MFSADDLTLDCHTCVAANTTACEGCIVQHLLANDAGPIEFVPSGRRVGGATVRVVSATERAVELFAKAGLLDDEAHFVSYSVFESSSVPQMAR